MKQYLEALQEVLDHGHDHPDRTGTGRRTVISIQKRFDLSDGTFPMVTTRYINPKLFVHEMLMFIAGLTNVEYLNANGLKFWDAWSVTEKTFVTYLDRMHAAGIINDEQRLLIGQDRPEEMLGEIGPMYGAMWRTWPKINRDIHQAEVQMKTEDLPSDFVERVRETYNDLDEDVRNSYTLDQWLAAHYYSAVDQLGNLVHGLKTDPYSSRHLVTAFNPEFTPIKGYSPDENVLMKKGCLMPCHFAFQCFVTPPKEEGGKMVLSLKFHMRSVDLPVGAPTNIAGYGLLLCLLAHCCDMDRGTLVFDAGDAHIYLDQLDLVKEQLQREPLPLPTLWINPEKKDLFSFGAEDIRLENYTYHDPIKYPVSV